MLGDAFQAGAARTFLEGGARHARAAEPFDVGDTGSGCATNTCRGTISCMPGYVRGKEGVVLHRTTVKWRLFPDSIGHGKKALHQANVSRAIPCARFMGRRGGRWIRCGRSV